MVQIGTIEYEAKVVGADEAKAKTEGLQRSQESLAASSEQSAASMNNFAGEVENAGDEAERTGQETSIADNKMRVFGSTLTRVAGSVGTYVAGLFGVGAAAGAASGAIGTLTGALSGLTLSGVVGSVTGALGGFVSWLAAGSAGALAFAGAVGAGLGLLGVWVLRVTGALNAVRRFGTYVGQQLPAFVRDGLLQIISLAAGPLAVLGGFITGVFEDGFAGGIANAKRVLQTFIGAWRRNTNRIVAIGRQAWNRIAAGAKRLKNRVAGFFADLATGVAEQVRMGFNATIPSSISLPETTLSAPDWAGGMSVTIGGQSLDLPQLNTGGMVEDTGVAVVDRGEAVIPEPIVSAAAQADRGAGSTPAGGGGDVNIDVGGITLMVDGGSFDPGDMSRREVESLADRIARALGKKTKAIGGTR